MGHGNGVHVSVERNQILNLRAVYNSRPQSGGLSSADTLCTRVEEGLQTSPSSLFGAKRFRIFRSLWCVRMDKGAKVNFS